VVPAVVRPPAVAVDGGVLEGYERADVGIAIERTITGGTGPYAGARGEAEQTFLGFTATEGVNLTFALSLAGASQP
jgi:hypothetical protein